MASDETPEIIGIDQDYAKPVRDRVIARMAEQGVICNGIEDGKYCFEGLGNKRRACLSIPSFQSPIPQDQQDSLYTEWTEEIARQLRVRE